MISSASASISSGVIFARDSARALPIRPDAVSRKTPMGSPEASLRISPPGGLGVRLVTPASAMARALAMLACPLACERYTGFSGDTRSSDACVGNPSTLGSGRAVHFSWCQPRPTIHSPGFAFFAAASTMPTISSQLVVAISSRPSFDWPMPLKWAWLSMSPGTAKAPFRSMTVVDGPIYGLMSASLPSAAIVSPRTAIARASGSDESTVTMRPF